ncbi:hypothetical protein [Fimbriimonas ginsengisoli]|uniref:Transglutaminase-like domain-containing protein n=1 Tax=Fimbriimonas ginsengisoli Gsoil 348 TaxID=661478 RepID=A0A068NQD3_FIMGI|nr:hypothetical protein [Fimbriimonas ginsengisoli]AIE85621.1 hypothetical protein OP10G_2253 [Fimbriimonas ginsengisoli Gsoil 348]
MGSAPDWDRLDRLTGIARSVDLTCRSWRTVADSLRIEAVKEMGALTPTDLYWLGSAWWAFHEPACHLRYPRWAADTARQPNLALLHPEGGNCESSANGHAALLSYLGVPSRTVYGKLMPSGEGHVWTISDVDGVPLAADVHLARATEWERTMNMPWRPSPAQIQLPSGFQEALRFTRLHRPDDPSLSPIAP